MPLDDILKFIDEEISKECGEILERARARVAELEAEWRGEKKSLEDAFARRLASARKIAGASAMTKARLEARLETLSLKRKALDELYGSVLGKIKAASDEEKTALYEKFIAAIAPSPDGEIVIDPADGALWKKLKSRLKHSKIEEGKFSGGFIYRSPSATWDFTLDNVFADFRAKTESEAAAALFGRDESDATD